MYTDYGKTISRYGGLRIAPHQAIEYAAWAKAKQLAWDRAYDKDGELCYICYYDYDAGNSAYAGFVQVLLTPEERREHYNGVSSPREELLGDWSLRLERLHWRCDIRLIFPIGVAPVRGASNGHSGDMLQQRPLSLSRLTRHGKGHNPNGMRQLSTSSTA